MRTILARAAAPALLLLVAGCGQPADTPAPAASPKATGYIAKVQALPVGQREAVLFRAVRDGGGASCQGIDRAEPLPPTKAGLPQWRVTCPGGSQWLVTLSDDGTALVTGARDAH